MTRFMHLIGAMLAMLLLGCMQKPEGDAGQSMQPQAADPVKPGTQPNSDGNQAKDKPPKVLKPTESIGHERVEFDHEQRLGGDYKGNYVWGAAMNLAWNEMEDNVLHEKAKYDGTVAANSKIVNSFNASHFGKSDLDAASYFVYSGVGEGATDAIRQGLDRKFPGNRDQLSQLPDDSADIVVFAYLRKKLLYLTPFDAADVRFEGKSVKGFTASNNFQFANVLILHYESYSKFLLRLSLKSKEDDLFLAKGFDMNDPAQVLDEIYFHRNEWGQRMTNEDEFEAPVLKLDHVRDYLVEGAISIPSTEFGRLEIASMKEHVIFEMDRKGVEVENSARMDMVKGGIKDVPIPKHLLLDKPYWVVMKRRNSSRPYFILGVRNAAMMTRSKSQGS